MQSSEEVPFNRLLVFFAALFLAVVVVNRAVGLVLPWGENTVAAAVGVAFASWVAYFGGYERLPRLRPEE
ncbi:hypothetical protein [Halomarina litorea]|uniref:hypothetical protein n=1 Tax=Halomarina litorea TaxID=2961595 RepID=UPI0020C2A2FE|nr:hypothetical protein [Halomarina sp. BCD28]